MTGNPMVTLNRAVAAAMVEGPAAGLTLLEQLDGRLGHHHRLHAVRAHLLEMAGDAAAAIGEFTAAAARATNLRERDYLTTKAAENDAVVQRVAPGVEEGNPADRRTPPRRGPYAAPAADGGHP